MTRWDEQQKPWRITKDWPIVTQFATDNVAFFLSSPVKYLSIHIVSIEICITFNFSKKSHTVT